VRVTVLPSGAAFPVAGAGSGTDGESVMAAAAGAGFSWPTTCGGVAECAACVMMLVDGDTTAFAEPGPLESAALASLGSATSDPTRWRLACQTRVAPGAAADAQVTVRKVGVRKVGVRKVGLREVGVRKVGVREVGVRPD
jgi:2Fe-2S ferredoxin